MGIKELQEELVEKISLIAIEDIRSNLERALEIVNELGRDYINNIITTNYKSLTALDYVIIADSQGSNTRLSERSRLNNAMLKELETAIRDIGGRTSEEETNTYREAPTIDNVTEQTVLHLAVRNGNIDVVRSLIERVAGINVENNYGAIPLHLIAERGGREILSFLVEYTFTNLEGVTVQSSMEGRGNSL
ncbi:ankyrin repeat domain-containing protein [Wolbachia endosymbiont of Cylisticus convexus]|uniref:ankyrin repeat domain-containing protein n=1 Tax=Wolbachia endosymbiont of Cylisticus convexus TaxID=118728 RepID=UPI0011C07589|nr:ankyrin repeat domain-containing protein [Wolbachia endosymbiont of Cylisticus convexus]